MRNSKSGVPTRYFGKLRGVPIPESEAELGDAIKTRSIKGRQRSTPTLVKNVQVDALRVFDKTRSPETVCDVLRRYLAEIRAGNVDTSALAADNRVSNDVDNYTCETLTVAALKRAKIRESGLAPGQTVRYVVADADARGAGRVHLAFENTDRYDADWYVDVAVRAVESVLAPVGWRDAEIRDYLAGTIDTRLDAW